MSLLNRLLSAAFDVVLRPLELLSPAGGVSLVSLATAVSVLLVARATLDPRRTRAARSAMYAAILEMRLFNDDLRAILRAQLALLKGNAAYVRASLVPMLWVTVPLLLLFVQLDLYYGYAGVSPGEPVLVTAVLRENTDSGPGVRATLASSQDTGVGIPGIWFPAAHEMLWSLLPQAAGEYDLHLRTGSDDLVKTLQVSSRVVRTSPARVGSGFVDQLRYPSEPPLPVDSIVKAIVISYPVRQLEVFGRQMHWSTVYAGLSLLFALALARLFRVSV